MKQKQLAKLKNWRKREPNEWIIECDNQQGYGNLAVRQICMLLSARGYRIEIYSHKGKSYHAHIKAIPHLENLTQTQNKQYFELLNKKYLDKLKSIIGDKPYFKDFDNKMCEYTRLIAIENKPHYRTGKIKKLIAVINKDLPNFCEKPIYDIVVSGDKQEYKPQVQGTGITAEIIKRVSIIDIAREFGLEVNAQGMAICPFHQDTNPSLKFYDSQGRFHCFGCGIDGNIIIFYALMKKLKLEKIK